GGRLLPGSEPWLERVPGLGRGGRLCVRGPNVMMGYLRSDRPGELQPPQTPGGPGWYDTGDVVEIDGDGFLYVRGRVKRFAKIGEEMISLARVEDVAEHAWPQIHHAALSVPEERKGERLVLLTERRHPRRQDLLEQARKEGVSELHVPKDLVETDAIPLLGAGKVDYAAALRFVAKAAGARVGSRPGRSGGGAPGFRGLPGFAVLGGRVTASCRRLRRDARSPRSRDPRRTTPRAQRRLLPGRPVRPRDIRGEFPPPSSVRPRGRGGQSRHSRHCPGGPSSGRTPRGRPRCSHAAPIASPARPCLRARTPRASSPPDSWPP